MSKNFIPTINISSLIKNNFETQNAFKTIKDIEKACVNVGFFQITRHGINQKEIKKTCDIDAWRKDYFGALFPINPSSIIPKGESINKIVNH